MSSILLEPLLGANNPPARFLRRGSLLWVYASTVEVTFSYNASIDYRCGKPEIGLIV